MEQKEPIKLRQKQLSDGNISLYLDYYYRGKRKYEFLRLYLIKERTKEDKEKNKQIMQLANAIKAKRTVELQNGEYGFNINKSGEVLFFDYFEMLMKGKLKEDSNGNFGNWKSTLVYLRQYEDNERITFADIDKEWVQGFKDFLDTRTDSWHNSSTKVIGRTLSQNTKISYFRKLRACLNSAVRDGIISYNPSLDVKNYKEEESKRMYLTLEELKKVASTECDYIEIKNAFLFSCLTGLRRSDIEKLQWGDVHEEDNFTRIIFTQKKTKQQEYLDINEQARKLMGTRGKNEDYIFHLPCICYTNEILQYLIYRAGIDKHITFHCGRHTFATMMLDLGTDIYTVSKLLGHTDISTTQIYAKIMDKNKQKAVANIPDIF